VHAPEQIRLDIYNLELGSVSEQFQENLMHRILSSAAISRDCDCEEQERRAMVPVYAFDLEGVFVWESHAAVSMVRQSDPSDLSISVRKIGGQGRDGLGTTYHEAGTLWMGTNPQASVTDTNGRFHHIVNAFCADQSLFVTAGSVNPTLTGLVLSRKVAQAAVALATGAAPPA
jgi:choline dehydrogenase-like flavoprotein